MSRTNRNTKSSDNISGNEYAELLDQGLATTDAPSFTVGSGTGGLSLTNCNSRVETFIATGTQPGIFLKNNTPTHGKNYNIWSTANELYTGALVCFDESEYVFAFDDYHFLPGRTNVQNIGSASAEWANIYLVNSPTVSSDETLKKDIVPLSLGLSTIESVSPIKYKYKKKIKNAKGKETDFDEKCDRFGFSAQELKSVLPADNTVIVENDDGTLGLRPMELIPIMWNAIKELSEQLKKK